MKKRLIIFDCFGVIFGEIAPVFFRSHFPPETAAELKDKFFIPADKGLVSYDELFENMAEELKLDKSYLLSQWESLVRLDEGMVAAIKKLRKNSAIALLSNAPEGFVEKLFEQHGLYPLFDRVCISSAVKLAKPDLEIYEHCLNMFEEKFDEIFFVDDTAKNLIGIEKLGITPIHFTSMEDMMKILEKN